MFCKKCGNQLKPDDKFCMRCGTPNTEEQNVKNEVAASDVHQTQSINPQQNPNPDFNPNQNLNPNQTHNPNVNFNPNGNFNPNQNPYPNPYQNWNMNQNQSFNPNPDFNPGAWGMMPHQNAPAVQKGGGALPKVVILIMTAISVFCLCGAFFFPIFESSYDRLFKTSINLYNIGESVIYFGCFEEEIANVILWSAIGITAVVGLLLLIAIINCIFSKHKSAYTLLLIAFIIITLMAAAIVVLAYVMKEECYYYGVPTVSPKIICVAIVSLVSTILTPVLRAKCS